MSKLRIVSDGSVFGTHVFDGDVELSNINAITINPLSADAPSMVTATITFLNVELDIVAEVLDVK